jgi:hypothetical protein
LLVLGNPDAAPCQERASNEIHRWVPSVAVTSDIVVQSNDGFLQNSLRPPTPGGTPNTPFKGSGSFTEPAVGGSIELMSPTFLAVPGRPRVFAHGDLAAVFGSNVELAKEGSPGAFEPPPLPPNTGPNGIPASAVGGQGSKTSAELDTLLASAGIGLAFTFDVVERRFRLKPSFEYVREKVKVDGELKNVTGRYIRCFNPPTAQCTVPVVQDFSFTSLSDSGSDAFHGIGAGLELEMDTVRVGPFMLTLFLSGRATQLLGDLEIELAAGAPNPATPCGSTACWSAEPDRWLYRGGAGLRFRFAPER